MLIEPQPADPDTEAELRRLQYTPEERDRLFRRKGPVDVDTWLAAGPPATPEELQEMEELLQLRDVERQASLARDAGLTR
jgi:hypothetical protein